LYERDVSSWEAMSMEEAQNFLREAYFLLLPWVDLVVVEHYYPARIV